MMSGPHSRSWDAASRACCWRSASSLLVLTAALADAVKWRRSSVQSTFSMTSLSPASSFGSAPKFSLQASAELCAQAYKHNARHWILGFESESEFL